MPYQVVFAWSKDCEKELISNGFEKAEVYLKVAPDARNSNESIKKGDAQFFAMRSKPYQFVTTSFWGAS